MNAASAQVAVLAAGGVILGVPAVHALRGGSAPSFDHRTLSSLVLVGGAALLASIAPLAGAGLAWAAALSMLLTSSSSTGKPPHHLNPGSVPRSPRLPHH